MYLEALLSTEVPDSMKCHLCDEEAAAWRCRDCLFNPMLCSDCCRDNHASNPFHRIDHWTGSYFEPAWLFQVGLVLHLGHNGAPCPSYFHPSAPDVVGQDAEDYEDDFNDATEGDGTNNIVKEMKRFTGIYDLHSTTFPTPVDCHELTVIDVSGVHRMWVKWCNCPNSRQEQENHLLQMGLFPVSYKNIKSTFTFKVLDDARLSNLECKSSAYQYYQKLRRITSPLFPNAVEV
jgi:CxC2 like cysteine cluster associated with KDZ transposases